MNPHPILSTPRLFRLMLWVQWRSFLARLRGVRKESPLLIFVLSGFIVGYFVIGFWIFRAGLSYLYHFPLVGSLLSQRILFLIFGFFFVMLVFSNLIIGYTTLFKNRETQWFLSLPLRHTDVYRWKFFEALGISSWALLFLIAPMMLAYGRVHEVGAAFYFQIVAVLGPFVVLPALAGSWTVLCLVRLLARRGAKKALIVVASAMVVLLIASVKPVSDIDATSTQEILTFDQLLRHTRLSVNPFLPSAWLAKAVLAWGEGLARQGAFYFLLLLSNAMMGMLIGFEVLARLFYGSWAVALTSRAERFQRRAKAKQRRGNRGSLTERIVHGSGLSQPASALVMKDVRLFWRDPAQWIQFVIFFGLLCIYVVNLRNVAFNFASPFWEVMISYLNLAASALTLSTLTTRFVFPQFSLEGRRLWILGLAPFGLRKVLLQKFWLSAVTALTITVSLMLASSLLLHLPWSKVLFFAGAIALMSASLNGLAVGLGALFPNFKEDNPSKIVSSFGGTLCLVISFIYISVFIALLSIPDMRRVTKVGFIIPDSLALALARIFSLVLLFVPLGVAARRVEKMEI